MLLSAWGPEMAAEAKVPRLHALLESVSDAIVLIDPGGAILYSGPSTASVLGYQTGVELGTSGFNFIHPDDRAEVQRELNTILTAPDAIASIECRMLHQDGSWRHVETKARNMLHAPGVEAVVVTYRDITERKAAEEALRESEESYRSVIAALDEGIMIVDPDGVVQAANESAARILGVAQDRLIGRSPREAGWRTFYEDGADFPLEEHPTMVTAETGQPQSGIVMAIDKPDGVRTWVSINAYPLCRPEEQAPEERTPYAVVTAFTDITERKRIEAQLTHAARHDPLTGLPNRALFMDRLAFLCARARRRSHYQFALLFLDLDHFKTINDSLGHMEGDHLLAAIGERLRESVRPGDTIARIGGDEFAVLIEKVAETADAIRIATRLQVALAVPFIFKRGECSISASIGVAISGPESARPEDMLRDADSAMCRAKAEGRGRFAVADLALRRQISQRLQLESDLRQAIAHARLGITFRPVVALSTNIVTEFAAVVAWRHPAYGVIPREELLGIADAAGLRANLDRLILHTACRFLQHRFMDAGGSDAVRVSVPVSGRQIINPIFTSELLAVLTDAGVEPAWLTIRVTEEALIEHPDAAIESLHALRALGVRIQLDQFGAGHSLLFLRRYPIDAIGIDCSFTHAAENETDAQIVRAIIMLAHNMQMSVIAEGIETEGQHAILTELGCDFGEGAYLARAGVVVSLGAE